MNDRQIGTRKTVTLNKQPGSESLHILDRMFDIVQCVGLLQGIAYKTRDMNLDDGKLTDSEEISAVGGVITLDVQ